MLHVALLGTAHIHTQDFAKLLASRDDVAVKWVWDTQVQRREHCAQQLGATPTDDAYEAMHDPDVAALIICSETNLHQELIAATLETGKPLFTEKPLALTAQVARDLAKEIERSVVLFHIGFFFRAQPVYQTLRRAIEAGHFGTVVHLHAQFAHQGALEGWFDTEYRWMTDPKQASSGAFADLGLHLIDLLLWLGGDVEAGIAQTCRPTGRYDGFDEYGSGMLRFANGATGSVTAGWLEPTTASSFSLVGTRGKAVVAENHLTVTGDAATEFAWQGLEVTLAAQDNLATFLDLVMQGSRTVISPAEAFRAVAVMEALQRSVETGRWEAPLHW